MRIAQVAPPFESIPPALYGGTERVVSLLTEELVRRGHQVTLFASGDSTTSARLVPTVDTALWRQAEIQNELVYWAITLGEVYRRAARGEFDVIHSHLDFLGFSYTGVVATPTVTTLHGRLDLSDLRRIYARFPDVPVVSISDHQRRPLQDANWVSTVYNGVDTDRLAFNASGGEYLAFLGRVSPDKGVDRAIRIARMAGMPLKVAARLPLQDKSNSVVRDDWAYYEDVVKPLLDEGDVEFVGEVDDDDKAEFLGHALALLNPIDWPEPFGLVMAEALSCGTPVIARRRGSVPELVVDGATGLIGETDEELAQLCQDIGRIKRSLCRQMAVWRFSVEAMTLGYERAYRRVIDQADLAATSVPPSAAEPRVLELDLQR